jgi:prephenate dehydratase
LPERAVVVHAGETEVGVRQPPQLLRGGVDVDLAGGHRRQKLAQASRVHLTILPGVVPPDRPRLRVGFLGPLGTFTEQALLSQPDLGAAELVPLPSMPIVLQAVADGRVDVGFVAIENSIEGTVNLTQDALIFNHDLLIQREVVLDVEQCLLGRPETALADVKVVLSIPVATAQCLHFLSEQVPGAELRAANSTAEAARLVGEDDAPGLAAIAPRIAGELYGLEILAADIADHDGNQTRFVVVGRDEIPPPTGHDKTSVVVYQRADEPGSLISILQEFAARRINLTKLESRPTKAGGLGDYCFVIDADGHIGDELLADALRALHAKQGGVKFLGSYPAAGAHASTTREHADARWRQADDWMSALRSRIS